MYRIAADQVCQYWSKSIVIVTYSFLNLQMPIKVDLKHCTRHLSGVTDQVFSSVSIEESQVTTLISS